MAQGTGSYLFLQIGEYWLNPQFYALCFLNDTAACLQPVGMMRLLKKRRNLPCPST